MKKLGLIFKETSAGIIQSALKESNGVLLVKYSGLSGPDLNSLRQNLRGANASLFVVKNTVARRALRDSALEGLVKNIEGPCGLVFFREEPVGTSKVLCDFAKAHEKLVLDGGVLQDKFLEKKDIESMAKLPSREVLRGQVVCTLNAPIFGIVFTLNQVLAKFVYCLEQIKNKKQ